MVAKGVVELVVLFEVLLPGSGAMLVDLAVVAAVGGFVRALP